MRGSLIKYRSLFQMALIIRNRSWYVSTNAAFNTKLTCQIIRNASTMPLIKTFKIYRYNPEVPNSKPFRQTYKVDLSRCGRTVLDALFKIKNELDPSLTFRRACREGICGACGMNMNGVNGMACTRMINRNIKKPEVIMPLPHAYVIKDLVVNMNKFYEHYKMIEPWLQRDTEEEYGKQKPNLQTIKEHAVFEQFLDCTLCACCSYSCPSYWWNGTQKRFLGPAAIMHAYRWITDSRDHASEKRLNMMTDKLAIYRCHTILNCILACPRNLNPAYAIAQVKRMQAGWLKKQEPTHK